jgi:glutamate-1-semialdehyde 2,1-aminomutase
MRAGLATLKELTAPGFYEKVSDSASRLVAGLRKAVADTGVPAVVNSIGSLATIFFTAEAVTDYTGAKRSDKSRYARYFREMLDRDIFLAPSQFEAAFVSAAHTTEDIDRTVVAALASLQRVAEG